MLSSYFANANTHTHAHLHFEQRRIYYLVLFSLFFFLIRTRPKVSDDIIVCVFAFAYKIYRIDEKIKDKCLDYSNKLRENRNKEARAR